MRSFLTRFSAIFSCFVFLFVAFVSIPVNALVYENKDTFKDIRFIPGNSSVTAYPDTFYNYDYWLLAVQPYSYDDQTSFYAYLYLIADNSFENFGSVEGTLKFETGQYPYQNKLNAVSSSPALDYEQSVYRRSTMTFSTADCDFIGFNSPTAFPSSYVSGFVFDNHCSEMFPAYKGSSSNFTSKMIIASNVDLYDYNGNLLQYGNYYTLLQYMGDYIDGSRIKDYSGHETAPGVVVEPTTDSSSGGTAGDNGTSQEQLETSKGILGTVKEIFNSIASLPEKIAGAISGFFDNLLNGIIEGLKFLFIPDDNPFEGTISLVREKFGFIFQIIDIADFLLTYNFNEAPPDLSFSFPEDYLGNTRFNSFLAGLDFELLDWSVVEPYRNFIRNLIAGIAWYFYLSRLHKHLPDIINGTSGGGD